jgi:hypothetical protein
LEKSTYHVVTESFSRLQRCPVLHFDFKEKFALFVPFEMRENSVEFFLSKCFGVKDFSLQVGDSS